MTPNFVHQIQDIPVDLQQAAARWFYRDLNDRTKGELESMRKKSGTKGANIAGAVLAWLNGKSMEEMPPEIRSGTVDVMEAFFIATLSLLSHTSNEKLKRYEGLRERHKMVPAGGKVISTAQPRMPWHDVQCTITGPAVSHLSRNFVIRWNGIAKRYQKSYAEMMNASGIGGAP